MGSVMYYWDVIGVILFVIFGIVLLKVKNLGPYFIFFYVSQLWATISCLYIESGIYITEEARYGSITGATLRLVFYNMVFFSGSLFIIYFLRFIKKENSLELFSGRSFISQKQIFHFTFLMSISINMLYFINALGTFILYHNQYTRFSFWDYSIFNSIPLIKKLLGFPQVIMIILGYFYTYFKNRKLKVICILNLLLQITSFILQGQKFTAIYVATLFFIIPILMLVKLRLTPKRTILIVSIFISFIGISTILSMNEFEKQYGSSGSAVDAMIYRAFGLQGHVWWGIDYELDNLNSVNFDKQTSNEINELIHPSKDKLDVGMKKVMILIGGDIGYQYIERGINFTTAFPAIVLLSFGRLVSIPILFILGTILGIIVYFLNESLKGRKIISALIFTKFYCDSMQTFNMGNFYVLLKSTNVVLTCLLVLGLLIHLPFNNYSYKSKIKLDRGL